MVSREVRLLLHPPALVRQLYTAAPQLDRTERQFRNRFPARVGNLQSKKVTSRGLIDDGRLESIAANPVECGLAQDDHCVPNNRHRLQRVALELHVSPRLV